MPRSAFGTAAAHARLGVSVLGTVTVTMFETEDNHDMTGGGDGGRRLQPA
nr:hypothetical protein [Rhizobium laguerreae]